VQPASAPDSGSDCFQTGSAVEVNAASYRNVLTDTLFGYGGQLWSGHEDASGNWVPGAEFECTDSSQCYSGYCNKDAGYKRDACIPDMVAGVTPPYELDCACHSSIFEQNTKCDAGGQYYFWVDWNGDGTLSASEYYNPIYYSGQVTLNGDTNSVTAYVAGSDTFNLLSECNISNSFYTVTPSTPQNVRYYDLNGELQGPISLQVIDYGGQKIIFDLPQTIYRIDISNMQGALDDGNCQNDGEKQPIVRTHGWCEPCTASTLAYQKIGVTDNYCPYYEQRNSNGDNFWYGKLFLTTECGSKDIGQGGGIGGDRDERCEANVPQGAWSGKVCNGKFAWPSLSPDFVYLNRKIDNYLKSGVMPIMDVRDVPIFFKMGAGSGPWNFSWWRPYDGSWPVIPEPEKGMDAFLQWIGNKGAMITIVADAGKLADPNYAKVATYRLATYAQKCPRCINSVTAGEIGDSAAGWEDIEIKLTDFFGREPPVAYGDPFLNQNGKNTELISFEYKWGDCFNYTQPTSKILSFSSMMLDLYRKPTLVTNLTMPSSCSGGQKALMLEYLFNHTAELADAGVVGVLFGNYDKGADSILDPNGAQGATFCALQQNSQKILGLTPSSAFLKTQALDQCECIQCSDVEVAQGMCPGRQCEAGGVCSLPNNAPAGASYKCPGQCVRSSTCTLCGDLPASKRVFCTIKTPDETRYLNMQANQLSDLHKDAIASLPPEEKCCLLEQQDPLVAPDPSAQPAKYTYIKQEASRQNLEQLIYQHTGNLNLSCSQSSRPDGAPFGIIEDKTIRCTVTG